MASDIYLIIPLLQ